MRRFYLEYCESAPPAVSGGSDAAVPTGQPIAQTLSARFTPRFALSWSHYVFLMNIGNRDERRFYEIEAQQNQWSLSELKRQFDTGLYERLALSRDKSGVRALARTDELILFSLRQSGIPILELKYPTNEEEGVLFVAAIKKFLEGLPNGGEA